MSESKLVTTAELARVLSVGSDTIARWRTSRVIPFIRINRTTVRYDVTEVIAALKRRQAADGEAAMDRVEEATDE